MASIKLFADSRYIALAFGVKSSSAKLKLHSDRDLAALAKRFRSEAGVSKSEASRQLGVNRGTIQQAEEYPDTSLARLRIRMIERYSDFKVIGPVYVLKRK